MPIQLIRNGEGYVCVKWNELYIIGCYFSPNKTVDDFDCYLNVIYEVVNDLRNHPCIVMGDFNARHRNWDSKLTTGYGQRLFD